jgi:hypothetical protein
MSLNPITPRTAVALVVGVTALAVPMGVCGQSAAQSLEGAWRVTQMVISGQTIDTPQPGLLLFTGNHYSYTLINGDQPRPDLPRGFASAPELLAVWSPFSANAGTFELSGDRMTRRAIVAKSPDAMAAGAYNEYTFRMDADTLWITTVGTEAGPTMSPSTVRYVRVR